MAQVLQFLALNELTFRGECDKSIHTENGLCMSLFRYTLAKDAKMSEIQKTISGNAKSTSPEIQNAIIDELASMITEGVSSDTTAMISQCYDGASCRSGDRAGVQRLIHQALNKEIPCVHCYNHKLHLVVKSIKSFHSREHLSALVQLLTIVLNRQQSLASVGNC